MGAANAAPESDHRLTVRHRWQAPAHNPVCRFLQPDEERNMSMFKKITIQLSHVCVTGHEVGSDHHPHMMIPLTGAATTTASFDVPARMREDIEGEWVYSSTLSPELLASKEFKDAAHEAVRAFKERITRRGPGRDVPDVVGTACYVLRWEGDQ